MARHKDGSHTVSRRRFLQGLRWSPMLFLPAPLRALRYSTIPSPEFFQSAHPFPFSDFRVAPRYPAKSPLESMLSKVAPGSDEFLTERFAFELAALLDEWSAALRNSPPALDVLSKLLSPSLEATSLVPTRELPIRSGSGIEVFRHTFSSTAVSGIESFLRQIKDYFSTFSRLQTSEFQIVAIEQLAASPLKIRAEIRYELVGDLRNDACEQRTGIWNTQWVQTQPSSWLATKWTPTEETLARAREKMFIDITASALGQINSYKDQMLLGVDHWRTVLDAASGIDVYGNNGIAAGDFDNDGFDDFYVCQPAGLPNRLYRNRGDGTFEDVTEKAGVAVLDATASALFADFENKGLQDLLVVTASGPLLFLNQGNSKFSLKRDAFQFETPPQGTFTHAALADYDGDGRLDIYFCLYSYYLGLDQYHYPAPYFDARNGPSNFLLHNEGNAMFRDRTAAAGLNVDNDRYSFACAWGDSRSNGCQDLYVANDFGRSNLYRNNGDGTFTAVSAEAGVEDPGAGMSACWLDYDNDGHQDIYVSNMWSAAGIRVSGQKNFHPADPEEIRSYYRRHARGNSLYRNQGDAKFQNVSAPTGVELGRWAWSSDSWDFDHDGYSDIYVSNGYISGPAAVLREKGDLSSFFWRQVVGNSPPNPTASPQYEQGWHAINELIRTDSTWNGYERNVLYANNRNSTFSDLSGISGLDVLDDSRSFALADLDHDGRLEVILKNRNAPQLRILHNAIKNIGLSISFRLRGQKSNRDAIGVAVTVESGSLRQTKYLQAGSGFLSQHSKELFFGLGDTSATLRATVRWPSGHSQNFENLLPNHRFEITEGVDIVQSKPFNPSHPPIPNPTISVKTDTSPSSIETWLIEPLPASNFLLPDLSGKNLDLHALRGKPSVLIFWSAAAPESIDQLRLLQKNLSSLSVTGLQIIAINADDPSDAQKVRSLVASENFTFPVLLATPELLGVYNIIYRYLFDRRRDLALPTSFLLDKDAVIVKLYQGSANPSQFLKDAQSLSLTPAARASKSLPFPGVLHQGAFQRNEFTYGVAFFQHGYLEQAAASFEQVIRSNPENPEAFYNLGTLFLRRNALPDARKNLEQAVKLRPDYPEAWNNLGMIDAQEGQPDSAIRHFQQSLVLRPTYSTALLNLGNLYRRLGKFPEAEASLSRALDLAPEDPEINYNLGMLYARQDQLEKAEQFLRKAADLRPGYPDALNNLGVLLVRQGRASDAESIFRDCIRSNPSFDQPYLNLARLYMLSNDREKARAALQSLLNLQPDHKLARQALEMLN
jgi:Flp pilus assembly protein TadD/peroxiredoxin